MTVITTIRTLALPDRKRGGERPPVERTRLNALAHGLRAQQVPMPGESLAEYEDHVTRWFESLAPRSPVEADIVTHVAALAWKVSRWERVERSRIDAHLEQLINETPAARRRQLVLDLIRGLDGMRFALADTEPPYAPTLVTDLLQGVGTLHRTLEQAGAGDPIKRALLVCCVSELHEAPPADHARLRVQILSAADELIADLREDVTRLDAQLDGHRRELAPQAAMLPERERRLLGRYRKEMEESMSRQLRLLEQIRQAATSAHGDVVDVTEPVSLTIADGDAKHLVPSAPRH